MAVSLTWIVTPDILPILSGSDDNREICSKQELETKEFCYRIYLLKKKWDYFLRNTRTARPAQRAPANAKPGARVAVPMGTAPAEPPETAVVTTGAGP